MSEQMQSSTPSEASSEKSLTIKIPKVNAQVAVLALLALVTVFQTAQLYALKAKAGNFTVKSAATAAPAAASQSGSDASMPEMVGGC